jgi:metal-sulfur cluster biosynthetic enzyme
MSLLGPSSRPRFLASTFVLNYVRRSETRQLPYGVRFLRYNISMPTVDNIMERLRNCYDPEIPLNIVDLGLIYNVQVENEGDVTVEMTLTAQGCPSHTEISRDVRTTLLSTPGVNNAKVNVVWDPPWTPDRISPEGRQKLGIEE